MMMMFSINGDDAPFKTSFFVYKTVHVNFVYVVHVVLEMMKCEVFEQRLLEGGCSVEREGISVLPLVGDWQ